MVESAGGATILGLYMGSGTLYFTADSGATAADSDVAFEPNTWYIARGVHDNAGTPKTKLYVNGILQATTANANRTAGSNPLYLGTLNDESNPFGGGIAQGIVLGDVTDKEIRTVENALADQYGIALT